MPSLRSLAIDADGIRLVNAGGAHALAANAIPHMPISTAENFINNWLVKEFPDLQAVCHVFAVSPTLQMVITVTDLDVVLPPTWWEEQPNG